MPGARASIDGVTDGLRKEYAAKNAAAKAKKTWAGVPTSTSAHSYGPAVPQVSQMKLLHDAAQAYKDSKNPAMAVGSSKVTQVVGNHISNVIQSGAIVVKGGDP